jgi:GcrA cell cycle regulator
MSWDAVRNNPWTDERVERLKVLWVQGEFSASQIANLLGDVTRSAVIGKAHRLGLAEKTVGAPRRTPRVTLGGGIRSSKPLPKPKPAEVIHADVLRIEADLPATDDPQSASGCRWIIGDPGVAQGAAAWRFCQRPRGRRSTGAESMWCEEHHALGHQQPGKGRAA